MAYGERTRRLTSFVEEVWSQGRIEACDSFIGATYTVRHDPGDPWDGQTLSLSAFKERVRLCRAPVPDQRFTLETILEDRNAVAIAWTWAATHQGDCDGFSASGARITMSG
ncbi:MAG: ester cyclase [Terriglobales bacterium]